MGREGLETDPQWREKGETGFMFVHVQGSKVQLFVCLFVCLLCKGVWPACNLCTTYMPGAHRSQKMSLDTLARLPMVVSLYMDAGN